MSSIKMPLTFGLALSFSILALAGCGDKNSKSTISADSGMHVAGWLPGGHSAAAALDIVSCTECHGSNYKGGISQVDCTTQCHLGDQQNIHPLNWGFTAYAAHGGYVNYSGSIRTSGCANIYCHGADLKGVASSGPSCSSCHLGGPLAVHPSSDADWIKTTSQGFHGAYVVSNKSVAACANAVCHGTTLLGITNTNSPSCQKCHSASLYSSYLK